jgi:hypothetical protein
MAPPANATVEDFLWNVRQHNITGSDGVLVDWGLRVCVDLGRGYTPALVTRNVYLHTDIMTEDAAMWFVAAAVSGLCREFMDEPYNGYGSTPTVSNDTQIA